MNTDPRHAEIDIDAEIDAEDTGRLVGLRVRGSALAPAVEDGDLLLLDMDRCPWRPAGRWQAVAAPIVWAAGDEDEDEDAHLVRRLEWTPHGWTLTGSLVPPIPVTSRVLVLAVALAVYQPIAH